MKRMIAILLVCVCVLGLASCRKQDDKYHGLQQGHIAYSKTDETGVKSTISLLTDFKGKVETIEGTTRGYVTPDKKHYVVNNGNGFLYSDFSDNVNKIECKNESGFRVINNDGFVYSDGEDVYMHIFDGETYYMCPDLIYFTPPYGSDGLSLIINYPDGNQVLFTDNGESIEFVEELGSENINIGNIWFYLLNISNDYQDFIILGVDYLEETNYMFVFKNRKLTGSEKLPYSEYLGNVDTYVSLFQSKDKKQLFIFQTGSNYVYVLDDYVIIDSIDVGYGLCNNSVYDKNGQLVPGYDAIKDEFYVSVRNGDEEKAIVKTDLKEKESYLIKDSISSFTVYDGNIYAVLCDENNSLVKTNIRTGKEEVIDTGVKDVDSSLSGGLIYYTKWNNDTNYNLYYLKKGKPVWIDQINTEFANKKLVQVDINGRYLYYYKNVRKLIQDGNTSSTIYQACGTFCILDTKTNGTYVFPKVLEFPDVLVFSATSGLKNNFIDGNSFYYVSSMSPEQYVEYPLGQLNYYSNGKSTSIAEKINTGLIGYLR